MQILFDGVLRAGETALEPLIGQTNNRIKFLKSI